MTRGTQDLEARLGDRLRYEAALGELSAALLRRGGVKPPEMVVTEALSPVREAASAGRVYVFSNQVDDERGLYARRWVEVLAPGVQSASTSAPDTFAYADGLQRWERELAQGSAVHGTPTSLPNEEAELLRAHGVRSLLLLPVHVRGAWWGFMGFDDVESEREWTDEDVGLLQTAAVVLGAFIERGMANEALQAAHQQLLQTEKMATIGALVAGVAHEINTPLGAISSMHDTLVRGVAKLEAAVDASDTGVAKALNIVHDANQVIRSATSRVLEIVRRLKDFARYDQGELERVDLHEELTDTLSLAHHELKHGVQVHQSFGDIPAVEGYANQIDQVFLNLVVNAKQAMGGKGNLWISTAPASQGVEVWIEDDGPGIDDDKLEAIFAPGFTTKKKGAGLGLGLAICQQIVAKHHGRIRAENRPEGGARFVVWLPVEQPEGEADTQPVDPASTSDRLDFATRHPDDVSDSSQ